MRLSRATPIILNVSIASIAARISSSSPTAIPPPGENIRNYTRSAQGDWCATHTLVNPRASRAQGWAGHTDADLALKIAERTADGIVVSGCRMLATLAPMSEELLVFPSTVLKADPAAEPFALSFAIPCNAKGLKFICRDAYDLGRSRFDHPLSSRFDEMDCVVIFDKVLVPKERAFLCGDVARCNALYAATSAVVHMMHQVVVKNVAKSEFLLGLAARIAEASDAMPLQHVRERLAK